MKSLKHALSATYRETAVPLRLSILAMGCFLATVCLCLLLPACASTESGLAREQVIYGASTNAVAQIQTFLPYLPAPLASPAELVLGIVSAALGAWNLHQQNALKKLRNGNGNGNGAAKPPAAPVLSAQPSGK